MEYRILGIQRIRNKNKAREMQLWRKTSFFVYYVFGEKVYCLFFFFRVFFHLVILFLLLSAPMATKQAFLIKRKLGYVHYSTLPTAHPLLVSAK